MALSKTILKADIKAAFESQKDKEQDQDAAIEDIADKIATAVDSYVKSAQIFATPAQVTSATMVAGGSYPVVATNNLSCTLK